MHLEGNVSIVAPRQEVWESLTDPYFVGQCAPGLESMEIIEPNKKFQAILISRRRNTEWFENDSLKFADLMLQTVLPAFEPEDLEKFMPYTKDELLAMSGLLDPPTLEPPPPPDGTPQFGTVVLRLPRATYDLWKEWKERVEARRVKKSPTSGRLSLLSPMHSQGIHDIPLRLLPERQG